MKVTWEVDANTLVEAHYRPLGKEIVTINGREVVSRRRFRKQGELALPLPDGRAAVLRFAPQLFAAPIIELHVGDRLMIATPKEPMKCAKCAGAVRPNDAFCEGCGQALPGAEHHLHLRRVGEATGAMRVLAALFSIFGLVMFFASKAQASKALEQLAGMDAQALVPLNGASVAVGELRRQIQWEPWGVLFINLLLAAIMVGLAIWGKRAPLPAVLTATATYAVVIVANGIVDPPSLAQGMLLKIVIIAFFVKGIKAALALRAANG